MAYLVSRSGDLLTKAFELGQER
ncbi:MAG: hypothetical protein HW404_535, partial [Anaerolineales bacterium]|nr:hypothetical protein [Anaerolineales bacterium]